MSYVAVVATVVSLIGMLFANGGTGILMPGPLSSSHAAIDQCTKCHTGVGEGKLSWFHALFNTKPNAESEACLSCHTLGGNAGNPHGTSNAVLTQSTRRLQAGEAAQSLPLFSRVRSSLFSKQPFLNETISCATCHREHRGGDGKLSDISNDKCQSCHTVQFNDFDGNHPNFTNYPFKRRTRIAYNHAAHFQKHFPEIAAKNDSTKRIPTTCSTCHSSHDDRRHMVVTSFDQTCSSCHVDQITGKERATGPKGIAFLSLPGLDVETLKAGNIDIGEWPEFSEAEFTPFMKLLISRTPRGKELLNTVADLDLLDLTAASQPQRDAVAELVWEIKRLFYTVVTTKTTDIMAELLNVRRTAGSSGLLADLSGNIPRDVVIGAQQEWLPNLGVEMETRKASIDDGTSNWASSASETKLAGSALADELPQGDATQPETLISNAQSTPSRLRLAQADGGVRVDPFGRIIGESGDAAPEGPPEAESPDAGVEPDAAAAPDANADAEVVDQPDPAADAESEAALPADAEPAAAAPAPPQPIESSVDAESWAEHGGWYKRDFAIFYRPGAHKDRFIKSWIDLTGPAAGQQVAIPPAQIFAALTSKSAQGQCTKCHSVEAAPKGGLMVNWSPASAEVKNGRFTRFVHEPHFRVLENRSDNKGCLSCHSLKENVDFDKLYEASNPRAGSGNFKPVDKTLCQSCHTAGGASQDCLLCHKYHVEGVLTPTMSTTVPRP